MIQNHSKFAKFYIGGGKIYFTYPFFVVHFCLQQRAAKRKHVI
jgi:hypothetical protein